MSCLRDFLPRAGMVYESDQNLLGRQSRDAKILNAFCQTGFVTIAKDASNKDSMKNFDDILAETFAIALQPHLLDLLRLGEATFFCFFWAIVSARQNWNATPRSRLDISMHSKTALQIDALLEKMGVFYSPVDYEIYKLVGGLEEDDDDDMADFHAGSDDDVAEDEI
ncbi:hypothetical protein F5Y06DRAFT_295816 [Hypoxylon sp. FL0890]|nr:hypothetical protein F5Y06DRAFT_295816 [Hypoxylon sp. FL0890]